LQPCGAENDRRFLTRDCYGIIF
jgi:hypothetical protein